MLRNSGVSLKPMIKKIILIILTLFVSYSVYCLIVFLIQPTRYQKCIERVREYEQKNPTSQSISPNGGCFCYERYKKSFTEIILKKQMLSNCL